MLVLGIMSGTSIDGVDCALCHIAGRSVKLQCHWRSLFPKTLQRRLEACAQGASSSHEAAQLHHDLGRFYVRCAQRGGGAARAGLVGLHGQTVFHQPSAAPATLQLGEPAYLAEALRVPVISNFRAGDMAAGGQGAPLATLFHCAVFGRTGSHVCVHNLGGISNVTSIDARQRAQTRILAFDTGPGNVLIDLAMRAFTNGKLRFDRNGAWARRGRLAEHLLGDWLEHPFFALAPPKSTGRELFGERFLIPALESMRSLQLSNCDQIAMFTELTARSIRLNYESHLATPPDLVIIAGGGARNANLVRRIRRNLELWHAGISVETCDKLGWPPQSIEPAAFALLAYHRFRRRPGNLAATTGARRPALLGQITEASCGKEESNGKG